MGECPAKTSEILGDDCSHGPLLARLLAAGGRALADLALLHELSDDFSLGAIGLRIAQLPRSLRLTSLAEAHLSQARPSWRGWTGKLRARREGAAKLWHDLDAGYPTAYAKWRHAEALLTCGARRQLAERPLTQAHAVAQTLGAEPLRREIEALAGRARLSLRPSPAAKAELPFGLTARELEVLALLARGQTNRQVAAQLFISEKTASIHVSRILTKLAVSNRGAAAAIAHQLGLSATTPPPPAAQT